MRWKPGGDTPGCGGGPPRRGGRCPRPPPPQPPGPRDGAEPPARPPRPARLARQPPPQPPGSPGCWEGGAGCPGPRREGSAADRRMGGWPLSPGLQGGGRALGAAPPPGGPPRIPDTPLRVGVAAPASRSLVFPPLPPPTPPPPLALPRATAPTAGGAKRTYLEPDKQEPPQTRGAGRHPASRGPPQPMGSAATIHCSQCCRTPFSGHPRSLIQWTRAEGGRCRPLLDPLLSGLPGGGARLLGPDPGGGGARTRGRVGASAGAASRGADGGRRPLARSLAGAWFRGLCAGVALHPGASGSASRPPGGVLGCLGEPGPGGVTGNLGRLDGP